MIDEELLVVLVFEEIVFLHVIFHQISPRINTLSVLYLLPNHTLPVYISIS